MRVIFFILEVMTQHCMYSLLQVEWTTSPQWRPADTWRRVTICTTRLQNVLAQTNGIMFITCKCAKQGPDWWSVAQLFRNKCTGPFQKMSCNKQQQIYLVRSVITNCSWYNTVCQDVQSIISWVLNQLFSVWIWILGFNTNCKFSNCAVSKDFLNTNFTVGKQCKDTDSACHPVTRVKLDLITFLPTLLIGWLADVISTICEWLSDLY